MLNVQGGLGNKQGIPNSIKKTSEHFFRGRNNNFGRQLVPRFDNAGRKGKLAACQMRQLMAKFKAMATTIGICWCLEELINGRFTLPWRMLYIKTKSARNRRWTYDGRPSILSRCSYGKCLRPFTSRVASFCRRSARTVCVCGYGDTA